MPVAHVCNPSCSGGRDQENRGSKPACANSSRDPISKKTLHKKGLERLMWYKTCLASMKLSQTQYQQQKSQHSGRADRSPKREAQRQWLTPVILATWEAEMGRITVRGWPGFFFFKS
jgi:hypothetical protein